MSGEVRHEGGCVSDHSYNMYQHLVKTDILLLTGYGHSFSVYKLKVLGAWSVPAAKHIAKGHLKTLPLRISLFILC